MSARSVTMLLLLLLTDKVQQSCREMPDVGEARHGRHVVVVSLEQLEMLCSARDEEGFLFIVTEARLDQDREIAVVVVNGVNAPCLSAGLNGLGDGAGLLGRDAAQRTDCGQVLIDGVSKRLSGDHHLDASRLF